MLHSALVNDTACRTNHDEGEENTEAAVVFLSSSAGSESEQVMGHWSDSEVLRRVLGCEGACTLLPLCCTVGS